MTPIIPARRGHAFAELPPAVANRSSLGDKALVEPVHAQSELSTLSPLNDIGQSIVR